LKRLFWLMTGMALGVWAYRYYLDQSEQGALGDLTERSRRLSERGKAFAESGRALAQESREFVGVARGTAESAINTAQERGRDVAHKVRVRTGMDNGTEPVQEEVREGESPSTR